MAGVYIEGFEMPKFYGDYDATFCVDPNGKITVVWSCKFDPAIDELCGKVDSVPDHGRLIDADGLMERFSYSTGDTAEDMIWIRAARRIIIEAPTIIPADKEGKEWD